ncbi:MAG: hypothetical protein KC418_15435, partial [Anaerolineales bacterium]|nr:hypothetical protein [Anaerolineales bacterium]
MSTTCLPLPAPTMSRNSNFRRLIKHYRRVEQGLYDELRKSLLGIAADEIVFGGDFEACALQIEDMIG